MRRFIVAHLLAVVGEWTVTIGALVHAYDWGGARAVGLISVAVLAPSVLAAPVVASAAATWSPQSLRLAAFGLQAGGYGAAAAAAAFGAPTPVVAGGVLVGLAGVLAVRPSGAALLPAAVDSAPTLIRANLAVAHCDSASALVGPMVAASLQAAGGPVAVFGGAAAAAAVGLAATSWRPVRAPAPTHRAQRSAGLRTLASEQRRSRPWIAGVVGVASARNLVIGAFDVLLVIVALDVLDLGDGGPGLLAGLLGAGAVASTLVTTLAVRRTRLRPVLVAALAATAASCAVLGALTRPMFVFALLPAVGLCLSATDNLGRILLQRSTDPRAVGALFAGLGLLTGLGQLTGSAIAQILVSLSGVPAALVGVGALIGFILVASFAALRRADEAADVPVVDMALLAGMPMFAPLPTAILETVARAGRQLEVKAGTDVVVQGEAGDRFYAVRSGAFDVMMSGGLVRTAQRGGFFGEVALLAPVPRTATVTATVDGSLLAIDREDFLVAVTGHASAREVAVAHVRGLTLDGVDRRDLPEPSASPGEPDRPR